MQKTLNRTRSQRIARVTLKVILFLFLFIVVLFLFLLTPPGQQFATGRVENYLQKKLQTKVSIGSLSIGLPRKLVLHDVYLEDQTKDTLMSGGTIKADIELFKLFSNQLIVHSLQMDDITAKVKRVLPDTVFNFQFVIDAFVPAKSKAADTAVTAMKLDVRDLVLNNFNVVYNDVVTGNDMFTHISYLKARIDTLDPYISKFSVPSLAVNGLRMRFHQRTPLATPESYAADMARVGDPVPMTLRFGKISLKNIDVDYGNDVSAFYSRFLLGNVEIENKDLDLAKRKIHLAVLKLDSTSSAIRLGKKAGARILEKEVEKELLVADKNDWIFQVDKVELVNNQIAFDNENKQRQPYGIDYAHFKGEDFNLSADHVMIKPDSVAGKINSFSFREKSGFRLDELRADFLYTSNQTFVKDLYLKTPGTELQRNIVMEYTSVDALSKDFEKTIFDIELVNSRVQVKDILAFAPQLRFNPAFSDPNDIWRLNITGSGTANRLHFETLQFDGLKNTSIDAYGTLAGAMDPNTAGGVFTIRRLHTSQTDIALFTGKRLSTREIKLPETFSASGTLSGNM